MLLNKYKFSPVILLFSLALVLSSVGLWCRSYDALSLFWPGNAVLLGLLIRFPSLNCRAGFPAMYLGMVIADLSVGTPPPAAFGMDAANLLFILVGRAVLLNTRFGNGRTRRLQALMRTFPAAVMASAVAATIGSVASAHYYQSDLLKGWIDWFCEQFSTTILLLPLTIAIPRRDELPPLFSGLPLSSPLPLLALLFSTLMGIWVGGGGSLLFPLPALLWSAIRYPMFLSSLLTLLTGMTEIILVANNVLNIQGVGDVFRLDSLASARLGVAAMTISPLIVALSASANRKLVARVTQRADYDFLTGALTRSGLSQRLETQVNQKNKPQPFLGAVLLLDIDHFKKINDTWGHAAGDVVLIKTVECIRNTLHQSAIISRMGGEEFLILMEGLSQPRASLLAERLRSAIEANSVIVEGADLSITVSIGICSINISQVNRLDAAIQKADEELYIAKSSGRNRVSPQFSI
ncbi:GGDEF domain-containing protein [Izhakiella australiensis]|uniref:diguanylate cyclase n=1 Tax=Izhakiella australiensis TaxID=1926881 RepID=A0A1S8YP66_9GAMM|nr:diguanylate cyclase [Izhakiella australiensis]OON40607.1 GGDEF domain-containing protein [Izhakiella australiensis]